MGYNIHITLADEWTDSESNPITSDLLEEVSRISHKNTSGVNPSTGEVIEQSFEESFYWPNESSNNKCMFHLMSGRLVFKYSDDSQIEIAKDLASYLGAKVQGDEGEEYKYDVPKGEDNKYRKLMCVIDKLSTIAIVLIVVATLSTFLYIKIKS
jgi:hypothetical protein